MLKRKKLKNFLNDYFTCFLICGLIGKAWKNPYFEVVLEIMGILLFFMLLLLPYLTWRDTHSFREVCRQNKISVFFLIFLPLWWYLLYILR